MDVREKNGAGTQGQLGLEYKVGVSLNGPHSTDSYMQADIFKATGGPSPSGQICLAITATGMSVMTAYSVSV